MNARYRDEVEFTLTAVVNAIASGKLPPDDARAWARIAACEARALADSEARSLDVAVQANLPFRQNLI
jgi:hypothetical protein